MAALRRMIGALIALVMSPVIAYADLPTVSVGLIAPESGRSARAGAAHRTSTEWGLHQLDYVVPGPDGPVYVRLVPRDDRGSPDEAVRAATDLVEREHVVAILGPVNSASTLAVLHAGLQVPVISPLSTAPELTTSRDPWFFRATISDRDRMHRYAEYIDRRLGARGAAVLVYEDDAYGRGLADALRDSLLPTPVMATTWTELGADGTPAGWAKLAEGEGFGEGVLSRFPDGPLDVFVLGTNEGANALARGLDRHLRPNRGAGLRFFFVGGERLYVSQAPDGSVTIGEPALDDVTEQFVGDASTLRILKEEPEQFLVTSFETARFVLPTAIERVLADGGRPDDPVGFRPRLRDVLDTHAFDSLVPWRQIRFVSGSLQDPPTTPIFKLSRAAQRLDVQQPPPWFAFQVPRGARFLEEPVRVDVERYPAGDERIEVRVLNERGDTVATEEVSVTGGKGTLVYHPARTGRYRLWTNAVHVPSDPRFEVRWGYGYPLAVLGAIAGLLLAVGRPSSLPWPLRALTGILTGLALFAISSWGRGTALADVVPLPSFHALPSVNAFLVGLAGGWGGLEVLLRIVRIFAGDASAPPSAPPRERVAATRQPGA